MFSDFFYLFMGGSRENEVVMTMIKINEDPLLVLTLDDNIVYHCGT